MVAAAAHVPLLWAFGVWRGEGWAHSTVESLLIVAAVALASSPRLGRRTRTLASTFALVTASAVLVHLSGGYIEAHFHFFVVVTVVLLYQDWAVFGVAFTYVFVHHLVLGTLAPELVFNHEAARAAPLLWAGVHGSSVLAVSVAGLVSWRVNERERRRVDAYANELQQALGAKDQLLAAVSHDLRSPLVVIAGYSELLAQADDRTSLEDVRQAAKAINDSGQHLAELVDEILLSAAVQAGGLTADPRRVRLDDVVAELASGLGLSSTELQLAEGAGLHVHADPRHLRRILANLVSNATKHGRPPIHISASNGDGRVAVRVTDHGDGVPDEFVHRLFDPFTQAARPRGRGGVGLGLSLVRDLAHLNGGSVRYEPTDEGASFVVELPAARG